MHILKNNQHLTLENQDNPTREDRSEKNPELYSTGRIHRFLIGLTLTASLTAGAPDFSENTAFAIENKTPSGLVSNNTEAKKIKDRTKELLLNIRNNFNPDKKYQNKELTSSLYRLIRLYKCKSLIKLQQYIVSGLAELPIDLPERNGKLDQVTINTMNIFFHPKFEKIQTSNKKFDKFIQDIIDGTDDIEKITVLKSLSKKTAIIQQELLEKGMIDEYLKFNWSITEGYTTILEIRYRKQKRLKDNVSNKIDLSSQKNLDLLINIIKGQFRNYNNNIKKNNK